MTGRRRADAMETIMNPGRRLRIALARLCLVGAIAATPGLAAAAELLTVAENTSRLLRLGGPAETVLLADPAVADVVVESPTLIFVLGRAAGETNLILLDADHQVIADYDLIVVPQEIRHVRVHRNTDGRETLSCDPACTRTSLTGPPPGSGAPAGEETAAPGAEQVAASAPAEPEAGNQQNPAPGGLSPNQVPEGAPAGPDD